MRAGRGHPGRGWRDARLREAQQAGGSPAEAGLQALADYFAPGGGPGVVAVGYDRRLRAVIDGGEHCLTAVPGDDPSVAEEAGTDADDACAWAERLGWAFGLIAEDPVARGAALVRLAGARRRVADALDRSNEMWLLTRPLGAVEQYREPAFRQALQRHQQAQRWSLPDGLWNGPVGGDPATWPGLPYALLFLEWEARHPLEWTRHAKAWGTKESLIREVARAAQEEATKAKLTDLVEIVVHRAYRCKDREYVRVARAVDSADLRDRLDRAADADSPWARCHAGYVLWLLDRPDLPNTRRVWRTWVAGEAGSLL